MDSTFAPTTQARPAVRGPDPDEVSALMRTAQSLKQANDAGKPAYPLRGKKLALLSHDERSGAAATFEQAATALGAHVSRPALDGAGSLPRARLWSRLYDAVACEDEGTRLAAQIEIDAGVPVFNGLAAPDHPLTTLAAVLALRQFVRRPLQQMTLACVAGVSAQGSAAVGPWVPQAALMAGLSVRVVTTGTPIGWAHDVDDWHRAARVSGCSVTVLEDWDAARSGADIVIGTGGPCPECWRIDVAGALLDAAAWGAELAMQRSWLLQAMLVHALA